MATPIRTPEPDVPAPPRRRPRRRRRAGPRWLDFSIGATALVVSAASLLVARHQAKVMDRQLAASVWPWVRPTYSNVGPNGEPVIALSLDNRGVGPARLQSFRVSYRKRPIGSLQDLAAACCVRDTSRGGPRARVQQRESYVLDRVAGAGEHVDWLALRFDTARSPVTARAYGAVNRALPEISVQVCYCSVLDECWISADTLREPVSIPSCANERKQPQYR